MIPLLTLACRKTPNAVAIAATIRLWPAPIASIHPSGRASATRSAEARCSSRPREPRLGFSLWAPCMLCGLGSARRPRSHPTPLLSHMPMPPPGQRLWRRPELRRVHRQRHVYGWPVRATTCDHAAPLRAQPLRVCRQSVRRRSRWCALGQGGGFQHTHMSLATECGTPDAPHHKRACGICVFHLRRKLQGVMRQLFRACALPGWRT